MDVWIMDSGCSRHMTGHLKWFSGLNPVSTEEYITFGDNGQGKVMGVGCFALAKLFPREVAFVRNRGFEVRFKKGACRVLDAEETLVCSLPPFGRVFKVDLTSVSTPAFSFADIWKWHRRLGHLSFDLASQVEFNGPNPRIAQVESREGLSMPPLSSWQDGCHFSHSCISGYDLLSGSRSGSVGQWKVFKDEGFGFVRDLVLRLRNESHKAMRAIRSDNGGKFRNSRFENFCRDLGLEH
ncbi:hypothetical protein U9M48_027572 [Paspalum notatum var. saurae]|uniref:Integrase catalytic domain-containing protein n=1 Tax=Paspalum notatum var. saurae TaxID=547442 RepID=A0AAQ3X088_PASNO